MQEKQTIVVFEDNPLYVKNAYDQLGGEYKLIIIATFSEAYEFLIRLRDKVESLPEIILTDMHFPVVPNPEHVKVAHNLDLYDNWLAQENLDHVGAIKKSIEKNKKAAKLHRQLSSIWYFWKWPFLGPQEKIIKLEAENKKLQHKLNDEVPFGYVIEKMAVFLGIKFIAMVKSDGHGDSHLGYASHLFNSLTKDGINTSRNAKSREEVQANNMVVQTGRSKVLSANGYYFTMKIGNGYFGQKDWAGALKQLLSA